MNYYSQIILSAFLVFIGPTALNSTPQFNGEPKQEKKETGFEITGRIEGLKDGSQVELIIAGNKPGWDIAKVDSAFVKNGEFHIRGVVPEGPRIYFLGFEKPARVCRLLIDNGERISINSSEIGNIESFKHLYLDNVLTISGSPSNRSWHRLNVVTNMYIQNIGLINGSLQKISDSIGFNGSLVEGLMEAKSRLNYALFYSVLRRVEDPEVENKKAIPMIIDGNGLYEHSKHDLYMMEIYNGLDDEGKKSYYGKTLLKYARLNVGQPFPEFTLSTLEEKPISVKEIISKSKVTLVNFWGSANYISPGTSEVVRKSHAELREMYKRYKDKGLNIISVAAEDSASLYSYRKILREEKFPWPTVSDLKGNKEGSIINDLYLEGGHTMPNVTNVLIDSKGRIIAWDPTGIELQWYLWKEFEKE